VCLLLLLLTTGAARHPQQPTHTHTVEVTGIERNSPAVKSFWLRPLGRQPPLVFNPGQWLDLFLPRPGLVGGFSIASGPHEFQRDGQLLVSIKSSAHPPTRWMHEACAVGQHLAVRVGGKVYYDPQRNSDRLLLIAGGIGITPLRAIAAAALGHPRVRAALLYSARSPEDILYPVSRTGESARASLHRASRHAPAALRTCWPPSPASPAGRVSSLSQASMRVCRRQQRRFPCTRAA
jgi:ferredoxin-NADP reductase